jgi:uncharacterized protein with HEPN domain
MQLDNKSKSYLWDMLEACKDINSFVSGMKFEEFEKQKVVRFAVERQLLVIGEAANHIDINIQSQITEIPWKQIIGLRNIIAHDYGEILVVRVWKIATVNVTQLSAVIEHLIA